MKHLDLTGESWPKLVQYATPQRQTNRKNTGGTWGHGTNASSTWSHLLLRRSFKWGKYVLCCLMYDPEQEASVRPHRSHPCYCVCIRALYIIYKVLWPLQYYIKSLEGKGKGDFIVFILHVYNLYRTSYHSIIILVYMVKHLCMCSCTTYNSTIFTVHLIKFHK